MLCAVYAEHFILMKNTAASPPAKTAVQNLIHAVHCIKTVTYHDCICLSKLYLFADPTENHGIPSLPSCNLIKTTSPSFTLL